MKKNRNSSYEELVELSVKSIKAQAYLGMRFFYSEKHGIDQEKAEYWLLKASSNGCSFADAELGYFYFLGKNGIPDYEKSFKYLLRAENFSPVVNIGIGDSYAKGRGVKKDPEKAIEYLLTDLLPGHS